MTICHYNNGEASASSYCWNATKETCIKMSMGSVREGDIQLRCRHYRPTEDNIRDNLLRIWVLDIKKWDASAIAGGVPRQKTGQRLESR